MKKEILQQLVDSVDWWHTIDLPCENGVITTPGKVDYRSLKQTRERFGLPDYLNGKTVLDVGCWDGFFSFEAEKRGGIVTAIDPLNGCSNMAQQQKGFTVAYNAFQSDVAFGKLSLHEVTQPFDIVLYYGVLYHCENPIQELRNLFAVTKEYALIETAISESKLLNLSGGWSFRPGYNDDPTNKWYPSHNGLLKALDYVGFSSFDVIYKDKDRITIKAFK